jgi:hypothetical protein
MAGALDGSHDVPALPFNANPAGVDTGQGILVPSGAQVFYVRGDGTNVTEYTYDPAGIRERLIPGINKALSYCVSGRGDVVVVMEGHAETIANDGNAWSNLVAGVKIVGRGNGLTRPTITFTHANAQIDVAVANVLIYNMRFLAAGSLTSTTALTVANPFNVTAAGFHFVKNDANIGVDADQLVTDFIKLSAAADDAVIADNEIRGQVLATITSVIKTTGAVDRLKIANNVIYASAGASGQLLDLSNAACIGHLILNNRLANTTASSTQVIKPHATTTGFVDGNVYFVGDGGTAPASAGWSTFTTTYQHGVNYCVTTTAVSAILCPAADA